MFVIKENTTMMAISKGDSGYFTVNFTGDIPSDGVEALFTVKKNLGKPASIIKHFTVNDAAVLIELTSQDTNKLEPGDYYWDLRIIFSETEVETPIPPSLFKVLEVAGDV